MTVQKELAKSHGNHSAEVAQKRQIQWLQADLRASQQKFELAAMELEAAAAAPTTIISPARKKGKKGDDQEPTKETQAGAAKETTTMGAMGAVDATSTSLPATAILSAVNKPKVGGIVAPTEGKTRGDSLVFQRPEGLGPAGWQPPAHDGKGGA